MYQILFYIFLFCTSCNGLTVNLNNLRIRLGGAIGIQSNALTPMEYQEAKASTLKHKQIIKKKLQDFHRESLPRIASTENVLEMTKIGESLTQIRQYEKTDQYNRLVNSLPYLGEFSVGYQLTPRFIAAIDFWFLRNSIASKIYRMHEIDQFPEYCLELHRLEKKITLKNIILNGKILVPYSKIKFLIQGGVGISFTKENFLHQEKDDVQFAWTGGFGIQIPCGKYMDIEVSGQNLSVIHFHNFMLLKVSFNLHV